MKKQKLYDIRFYEGNEYSRTVGFKGRLIEYNKARRIVARLKRAGVQAIAAPVTVNI